MKANANPLCQLLALFFMAVFNAAHVTADEGNQTGWNQWRGPHRDGQAFGTQWPDELSEGALTRTWHVNLDASYSGPIVSDTAIFVTGTANKKTEVVQALDRKTGQPLWRKEWNGAISVPFFAAANGSWIRSTPSLDGNSLFVGGMRDVLVSLNATTGDEQWRIDFPRDYKSPLPAFGFVCSPLVDGEFLYVQAGASVFKLNKKTGKPIWQILKDDGGMMGSAFSSPVLATLGGKRQLIVQTREKLAGVDPETGTVWWEQPVPNYRGMNILTPVVFRDGIFTSTYQNKSWMFRVARTGESFQVQTAWENKAQAYMSTPVVIDGHAYLHLQNQRFTCINLATGERTWTSKPFGKYCSMVFQGDKILALDQRGILLLIKANPKEFQPVGEMKISDQETWAHLAISNDELFVRELNGLSVFHWTATSTK